MLAQPCDMRLESVEHVAKTRPAIGEFQHGINLHHGIKATGSQRTLDTQVGRAVVDHYGRSTKAQATPAIAAIKGQRAERHTVPDPQSPSLTGKKCDAPAFEEHHD